jgi:5-methylcytosine-specific restriction protein A
MPTAAPHPCGSPGCPEIVPRGKARCPTHERKKTAEADARRGSAYSRGYNARWQHYAKAFLQLHPLCCLCAAEGRVGAATVVDHIRAPKGNQQLFWEGTNHRPLCKPHHDARTDEGDFGRPMPKEPK